VNPLALLGLVGPTILAAPYRGSLELADRTEVRGGYFGFPNDPALNAETVPSATFGIDDRRVGFTLGYAPRLGLVDLQDGVNPSLLNSGFAEATWQTRSLRLAVDEYATYGSLNYSALRLPSASPAFVLQVNPLLRQTILYEASSTALTAVVVPKRRWSLRLALSYSLSGGADDAARLVLPLQKGPRFDTLLEYSLSRRETLAARALVEQSSITPGYDYAFLGGSFGYRRHFTRLLEAEVAGGVTETRSKLPPPLTAGTFYSTYGTIAALVRYRLPTRERIELRLASQLAPAINRISSLLTQQIQGTFGAVMNRRTWTADVEGGFAQTVGASDIGAFSLLLAQTKFAYRASKMVDLEAGLQGSWQKVGAGNVPSVQKLAFVAVTVHGSPLHF
jgi:hypothetical protein